MGRLYNARVRLALIGLIPVKNETPAAVAAACPTFYRCMDGTAGHIADKT